MSVDREELKRLAEAANGTVKQWYDPSAFDILQSDDAEFVAASSPAAVLSLLAELEAAEKSRDQLKSLSRRYGDALVKHYPPNWAFDMGSPELMVENTVGQIKAERDRLRTANKVNRLALFTLNLVMGQTLDLAESVLAEHDPEALDSGNRELLESVRAQMEQFQATVATTGES